MSNINSSIYTEEEQSILKKTIDVRSRIVDEMTKGGQVPYKSGDIRVLNEVMNSLDTSVNNSANTRLKSEDVKNNGELQELVASVLNSISTNDDNKNISNILDIELSDNHIPSDTVPGELDIEPESIDRTIFIGDDNDT